MSFFRLIHNILPVRVRLHRLNLDEEGLGRCRHRDDLEELETSTHLFCSCARSAEVWCWVRCCCLGILPVGFAALLDFELIRLMFPDSLVAPTVVWLVGNYLDLALPILIRRGPVLQLVDIVAKLKE